MLNAYTLLMPERLPDLVRQLADRRRDHCLPSGSRRAAQEVVDRTLAILFPHFGDGLPCDSAEISDEILALRTTLTSYYQRSAEHQAMPPVEAIDEFVADLPALYEATLKDAQAALDGDPAATSLDEVILAYPGFFAIAVYRMAHSLHRHGFPLLPRLMAEYAHRETGIDIHPGATIGSRFFIDHGTGVVIGETAVIGNGVKLYQGVTLGATTVQKEMASQKRHPTVEDHVVVYANATILGGTTVIGHDTVVAGNAWITRSVPPFSIVGRDSEVRARTSGMAELEFYI